MRLLFLLLLLVSAPLTTFSAHAESVPSPFAAPSNENIEKMIEDAEGGDIDAQFYMANLYDTGDGVEQSYEKAAYWYMKAAKQGDRDAQFAIATLYHDGDGLEQNPVEAYAWYAAAIAQIDEEAQEMQGELLTVLSAEDLQAAKTLGEKYINDYVTPFIKADIQEDAIEDTEE